MLPGLGPKGVVKKCASPVAPFAKPLDKLFQIGLEIERGK